jgi:hypothetical protein
MCLVIWRRMRPQPVRPRGIAISGVIIVLVVLASFVGAGGGLMHDIPALALIPVFLAAGIGLGFLLVRTLNFWTDPESGRLWMRGGPLFAVILVGSIALRLGARLVATGSMYGPTPSNLAASHSFLYDLSGDLLLLTLGLWGARAFFLLKRHREHTEASAALSGAG